MRKVPALIAATAIGNLAAADFSGGWAGTMEGTGGRPVSIYLTLVQRGRLVSGTMAAEEHGKQAAIERAEVRDDRLTFEVREGRSEVTTFDLTFTVNGPPTVDREIALEGTATARGQVLEVALYPFNGMYTDGGRGMSAPVLVHKVEPRYTEEARGAGIQGTVLLQVEIEPTGKVSTEHIRVSRSLGYGLDEQAIECVRQWRFKPALRNGYAVPAKAGIEVNFRL